jgi:Response regulator containing a CheY-like receiver domain and an HTH DNA-binding domain
MARDLYSQALNRFTGLQVIASVSTVEGVMGVIQSKQVDVVLLAANLEDGPLTGLMALQKINCTLTQAKAVLLFEAHEAHLVVPAFRAGVRGVFCLETDGIKQLCRCVKCIHNGQVWANSAQLGLIIDAFSKSVPLRIVDAHGTELLTKREEDVVRLVERGLTNKEIAVELHLSEHTIRNNLFRIFDKLGVSSRVELALYALNSSMHVPLAVPPATTRAERRLRRANARSVA